MSKSLRSTAMLALLLSACGGAPAGAPANSATEGSAPAAAGATSFDAADACATLPKEKVAEVTGLKVSDAILSRVNTPTAGTAGFSQCTYSFAGGGTLDFFARQSPIDDNTPDAIQRTKQGMIENLGATPVDVAGLGTAAFTVEQMHQLHVFIGGNKYIYFMTAAPPATEPVAEIELALAKAVIG